jgi:hypothetical protein
MGDHGIPASTKPDHAPPARYDKNSSTAPENVNLDELLTDSEQEEEVPYGDIIQELDAVTQVMPDRSEEISRRAALNPMLNAFDPFLNEAERVLAETLPTNPTALPTGSISSATSIAMSDQMALSVISPNKNEDKPSDLSTSANSEHPYPICPCVSVLRDIALILSAHSERYLSVPSCVCSAHQEEPRYQHTSTTN